jgi:TRAP-type mannitol/chloroaromatic compound transport system permease small subunit
MERLLAISSAIDGFLRALAHITGWLFLVAVVIICFDVVTRKAGYQLPYFTSTRLQELEWHVTSTLFLCWLGYGMVRNSHVRIDVFTAGLEQRKRDWIDFIGTLIFALPYVLIVLPYSFEYFWTSFLQLESSDAPNGLPARYVIKGIMTFGLLCVLLAAISILMRKWVDLFGPPEWHSQSRTAQEIEL